MHDWAPAHEAMYPAVSSSLPTHSPSPSHLVPPDQAQNHSRLRSMSVSFPWRQRPKSAFFGSVHNNASTSSHNLPLETSKSHGFGALFDQHNTLSQNDPAPTSSKHTHHRDSHLGLKRTLRRMSASLKEGVMGLMHRRTSVPAGTTFDGDGHAVRPHLNLHGNSSARPTTSQSAWHRLRHAASFHHRYSRVLHTGYGDRVFEDDLSTIESPTLPIPGSAEHPPIIPRKTGAAARQAAAIACSGMHGYDVMNVPPMPRPGWLSGDTFDDHESGIGIALTSSEMEAYVPCDGIDSDVDVEASLARDENSIVKVDFISQLPLELSIQILALLDAQTLITASRVCHRWHYVIQNQHIWRESFLREKTQTYATSGPVKPGAGLGVPPIQPSNNWKEIYRVKTELDKRWKEGKARPVYLNGHTDSIYCLQFDEEKIVTGSRDRTIRVWDLHTFACKLIIGPPEIVNDCSYNLLYDEHGQPVHYATVHDPDSPRGPIQAYHSIPALYSPPMHHNASILCLQYDDRILVTGSSDATCIVWTVSGTGSNAGYRPLRRLRHHTAAVLDLVFDEQHIVTCSKDISICVWDRATGALLRQLRGHSGPVNAVQMRGNTIVSCSGDFRVKLWNVDTGKNIREFLGHTKGLACSQFSEDGRYIASAGNDRVIRIWDANTGECVREMKAHENLVRSLHVDSISGRLVSASYDSDIKVWDMETGQPLLDFPKWHSSWVLSAKSDYRRIVSSGQDPKILILDFGAGIKGIEMLESCRRSPNLHEQPGYI